MNLKRLLWSSRQRFTVFSAGQDNIQIESSPKHQAMLHHKNHQLQQLNHRDSSRVPHQPTLGAPGWSTWGSGNHAGVLGLSRRNSLIKLTGNNVMPFLNQVGRPMTLCTLGKCCMCCRCQGQREECGALGDAPKTTQREREERRLGEERKLTSLILRLGLTCINLGYLLQSLEDSLLSLLAAPIVGPK
jgi:hypothetical protein